MAKLSSMRQRNGTPPQSVPEADEEDSEGQDSIEEDVEEEDNMDVTEDNAPQSEDDEDNNEYGSEDYDEGGDTEPQLMSHADIQKSLSPLHNVADRVWKQVEDFAKNLDRFSPSEKGAHDPQNWKDACKLVEKYKMIAENNLRQAENDRKLGRSPSGSRSRTPRQGSSKLSRSQQADDDIRRCRSEVSTWEILHTLLSMDDPLSHQDARDAQEHTLESLHRYSSDYDIWESFLNTDHFATECVAILKWLQSTADSSRDSIESGIKDLESEAERGEGLWASGWLYTKEEIKKAKRLRAWPTAIDPDMKGLGETFKNKELEPLVTQLDPDATSRQGRTLYKEDQAHEKAMWRACWELLRRGKSWEEISQWFADRGEGWRALSLRGASVNSASEAAMEEARHGLSRLMNYHLLSVWRQSCYEICKGHDYTHGLEEAVYGILAGHVASATKGCHTLDDHLFVHYNSMVIDRHRVLAGVVNDLLEEPRRDHARFVPNPPDYETVRNLVNHARQDPKLKRECLDPYKTIQAAIITKDYRKLFVRQGQALNKIGCETGNSKLFLGASTDLIDDFASNAAEDNDALRVTAHLFLITKALGYETPSDSDIGVMEDNLVGYIALLRQAGRLALIPLYASKLSESRRHRVLGQTLIDITHGRDRDVQIKLMKQYKIEIALVLESQFESNLQDANAVQEASTSGFIPRNILENAPMTWDYLKPQPGFMDGDIRLEDELLVRSMEWHGLLKGHWVQVCSAAATLYKRFLSSGHFAAAQELHKRVPLSQLSLANTGFDLSASLFPSEVVSEDEGDDRLAPRRTRSNQSPAKSRTGRRSTDDKLETPAIDREQLYQEAQTWRELEQLVHILERLEMWADQSQQVLLNIGHKKPESDKQKKELRVLFEEICLAFDPLLFDWLIHPKDEQEATILEQIRVTYLPQVILAFNSVLNFAGHAFSRDYMAKCMELATSVATDAHLSHACVTAKRMRDLTKAFAVSAKSMLYVDKSDKKKSKSSTLPEGANLEIWQVKPRDVGLA